MITLILLKSAEISSHKLFWSFFKTLFFAYISSILSVNFFFLLGINNCIIDLKFEEMPKILTLYSFLKKSMNSWQVIGPFILMISQTVHPLGIAIAGPSTKGL